MSRLPKLLFLAAWLGLLSGLVLGADTFQYTDGTSVTGDIISVEDTGMRLRLPGENNYSDRIPWGRLTQAELVRLQRNPKTEAYVGPFIEISERTRTPPKALPPLKEPERLPRPGAGSVLGSLFHSGLGLTLLLVVYAANLYAAWEIAAFRSQPPGLVCGVAAVLPLVGPIIFMAMPQRLEPVSREERQPAAAVEEAPTVNPMQAELPTGQHSSLHLHTEVPPADAGAEMAPPEVFARGQFTFNRRFFETRFSKFFGVVSHEKDKVIVVKSLRRQLVSSRIIRITPVELVLEVVQGPASEEVIVPFNDIQEVILKHKDAPL